MSIKVIELIHWLNCLPLDSEVGIDNGGTLLQSVTYKKGILMSIKVNELIHWLNCLPLNSEVGIDEGGLTIRSIHDDKVYLEVGGIPEELIITLKEIHPKVPDYIKMPPPIRKRITLSQLLEYINADRSEEWKNYTEEDWMEGWLEWCEGENWTISMISDKDTYFKYRALKKEKNND